MYVYMYKIMDDKVLNKIISINLKLQSYCVLRTVLI